LSYGIALIGSFATPACCFGVILRNASAFVISVAEAVFGFRVALLGGVTGAGIIYLFLSKVLMSEEENLDPAEYEMTGVLGRTSVPIREGGTGEIIYSQAGTRKTCGARAEDGTAITKGVEVIVTRYEKGIAYVRLWTEMTGEQPSAEAGES